MPAGPELQFEGDGTYTVKVSIGAGTGDGDDCLAGPSRSGSFSVGVLVGPLLAGEPDDVPAQAGCRPLASSGVKAMAPPGGLGRRPVQAGLPGGCPADEPSDSR